MTRFKNYLKNLFNKNISDILNHFYQHAGLKECQWISIAVNKNSFAESLLTKELDILTNSDAFSLKIAQINGPKIELFHRLFKNQHEVAKGHFPISSPLAFEYNILIDSLIETKIHAFQQLLAKLDSKIFTPEEVAQEDKALEWIKVSFSLLEKAIIESLTNPDLFFQTLLFMGKNPKTNSSEIRLITFNLDIKFEFLTNGILRIHIFNDKNAELGSNKKADLKGDFNFRKREMMDELIKLISVLSSGIKLVA